MPWKLTKSGDGYKVKNKITGKTYSKKPMSKAKAKRQLAALYANYNESTVDSGKSLFETMLGKALMTISDAR